MLSGCFGAVKKRGQSGIESFLPSSPSRNFRAVLLAKPYREGMRGKEEDEICEKVS